MEILNEMQTTVFWVGLWQIILVNIVLSGDNAVRSRLRRARSRRTSRARR